MHDILEAGSIELGHPLTPLQIDLCCRFADLMLEKNKVMNLTAITDPPSVASLHFLDSLAILSAADFQGKSVIDIGCGAGFPGVPLCIARPDTSITLLDSLKKRIDWLSQVLPTLKLSAECVSARAEDYALSHREEFDIAVSRAVARLNVLSELALPLVHPGGFFIAMKSTETDQELSEAANGISLLGGRINAVTTYQVPFTDVSHRLIVIQKIRQTPKGYPRRFSKIKQSPL